MTYKRKMLAYGGYDQRFSTPDTLDSLQQLPMYQAPVTTPRTPVSTSGVMPYAQAAGFLGDTLQAVAPNSGAASIGGGALKGAATGATIGSAFPGIGTAVGGAVGAVAGTVGGILSNNSRKTAQKMSMNSQNALIAARQTAYDRATLNQYDTRGNDVSGYYANGGFLRPQTNKPVYRGYRSMANQSYYPKMDIGGELPPGDGDPNITITKRLGQPFKIDPTTLYYMNQNYDPTLLGADGKFNVQKQNGYFQHGQYQDNAQWGYDPSYVDDVNIEKAPLSYKAMGLDNYYYGHGATKPHPDIPMIKSSSGRNRYASGGNIHIDPSHKGDFTAYLQRTGKTAHEALNSDDPHVRKMAEFAINIGHTKMANGGTIPLASDVQKFVGNSHEQGGIPIDPNGDGQAEAEVEGDEVQKDNQIYSDRLYASPMLQDYLKANKVSSEGTYADIASKLGRMKGKYETKVASYSPLARRTGKVMGDRMEDLLQATFTDQEVTKPQQPVTQYAVGGELDGLDDPKKTPQQVAYEQYLLNKNFSLSNGDKTPQLYDHMAGKFVPLNAPSLPSGYEEYLDPSTKQYKLRQASTATGVPLSPLVAPSAGLAPYQAPNPLANNIPGAVSVAAPMTNHGASGSWGVPDANPTGNPILGGVPAPTTATTNLVRRGSSASPYTGRVTRRSAALPAANSLTWNSNAPALPAPTNINVNGSTINATPVVGQSFASAESNPNLMDKITGAIDNYGADVLNLASFVGNQSAINKMKAPNFALAPAPRYNYNDRSGLARNQNSIAAKYTTKGLTNTSAQGRAAQEAAIYAQQQEGNNQINNQENQRRDAYNENYNQRVLQNQYTNTDIANRQADLNAQVNNEKIGLGIQNRNSLVQGEIANQATRKQEDLDRQKALTILASTQDPKKALNLLTKFMNPQMAKRLQLLYKRG